MRIIPRHSNFIYSNYFIFDPLFDLTFEYLNGIEVIVYNKKFNMALSEEIKIYEINYFGGGMNVANHPYKATIKLRRVDNTLIGTAFFHRSKDTMPDHDEKNAREHYLCHFHESDYASVTDILRNEKPVFFEFLPGRYPMCNIATGAEPVGDGE